MIGQLTPKQLRTVERAVRVGRGTALGLDRIGHKIDRCRVLEYGSPDRGAPDMERGTAIVEVWGTVTPEELGRTLHAEVPAHVLVVWALHPSTWRTRAFARRRWRRWRFRARVAPVLRRLGLVRPTWHGEPIEVVARQSRKKSTV